MIDLALASFGAWEKTIKTLYDKSRNSSYDDVRIARGIRIACLSNQVLPKCEILKKFPQTIIGDDEIRRLIHNDDGFEIRALLTNDSINSSFFSALFTRKSPFDQLDLERWRSLLILASQNELAETSHSLVFTLLETAPITSDWVWAIDKFLEKLSPQRFNTPQFSRLEAVLTKWASNEADDANWKPIKGSDSLMGRDVNLSPKDTFRCKIAAIYSTKLKHAARGKDALRKFGTTLIAKMNRKTRNDCGDAASATVSGSPNSTDAAYRSIWYSRGNLTVAEISRASQADTEVFELSILYNDSALGNAELRGAIEYSCMGNNFESRFQEKCNELRIRRNVVAT